jgi:hypothetical protein
MALDVAGRELTGIGPKLPRIRVFGIMMLPGR